MARGTSDRLDNLVWEGQGSHTEAVTRRLVPSGKELGPVSVEAPMQPHPEGRTADHSLGEAGATQPGDHWTTWLPSGLCLPRQATSLTFPHSTLQEHSPCSWTSCSATCLLGDLRQVSTSLCRSRGGNGSACLSERGMS